jgi:cell wall-associated NlpC family hydrolase
MALTLTGSSLDPADLVSGNKLNQDSSLFKTQLAEAAGKQYVVKSGDCLWTIAQQNSTTVANIKSLNNLTSDFLQIGQVLYLDNSGQNPAAPPSAPKVQTATAPETTAQNQAPNNLQPTQPPTATKQYVVKSGDNLWTIARQNSTTVANIKSLNNLTSDFLQIGQVLQLDNSGQTTAVASKTTVQTSVAATAVAAPQTNAQNPAPASPKSTQPSAASQNNAVAAQAKDASPSRGATQNASNILLTAKKYLGVRYVYGGESPKGFDCSGFVQYVFSKHGINLPRSSSQQATVGVKVSKSEAKPGDLVFFNTRAGKAISHVGIYMGNNQFIHASQNDGITITSLNSSYYKPRLVTIKRVLR